MSRMFFLIFCSLFAVITTVLFAALPSSGQAKKVDTSREPPLKFVLEVDGNKVEGEVGKAFELTGQFSKASAVVKTSEYRTFDYHGIRFNYPEKFNWETDLSDPQSKAWTMMGGESMISVFVVSEKYTVDDYIKELVEDFDSDNYDENDISIQLGDKKRTGVRLVFEMDDYEYIYDVFQLPDAEAGDSRILLLQDIAPDRNPESDEAKKALKLLKQSFRVVK